MRAIPIRSVVTTARSDSGVIANTSGTRILPDGRVLLNDATRKRLLLFDTTLKRIIIIADTAGEGRNKFGDGGGGLLPFVGDSTAWVDRASSALVVVDGAGRFSRAVAPIRAADAGYYSGILNGVPGFDAKGGLLYRGALKWTLPSIAQGGPDLPDSIVTMPDSAPIVRADFDRRMIDTIAYVHYELRMLRMVRSGERRGFQVAQHPLPGSDEWAYLADGTVAIVRSHDYHVDWYRADGTHLATPKMPFDWRRLSGEEKQAMVDSAQRSLDSAYAVQSRQLDSVNRSLVAQGIRPQWKPWKPLVVTAGQVPDYVPPIRPGSPIHADQNGNLWVVPSTSAGATGGGNLLDVISRNGEIVERVQLPAGRQLQGFGPAGTIYMIVPGEAGGPRIERARIIRP